MASDAVQSRKVTPLDRAMEPVAPFGPVVLRWALAIIIFVHGIGKLFGIGPASTGSPAGFAGFLDQLGVPAPLLFAWVVALVETVGPILIVVGFWTRWAALAILIDMTMAMLLVHAPNGFVMANNGIEFTLALAAMAATLLLTGPGDVYALERTVREDAQEDEAAPEQPT